MIAAREAYGQEMSIETPSMHTPVGGNAFADLGLNRKTRAIPCANDPPTSVCGRRADARLWQGQRESRPLPCLGGGEKHIAAMTTRQFACQMQAQTGA